MTNPKGSEPARPVPGHFLAKGEDVRADFAKEALGGILSNPNYDATPKELAIVAVELADALIAALSEPSSKAGA
jgi:hypothetical protein